MQNAKRCCMGSAAATPAVTRRETPTMLSAAKIEAETSATLKPETAST